MSELLLNPRAAGSRAREDLSIKHQYQYHHLSDTEARDKHTARESVMLIFKSAEGEITHTQTVGAQMCVGESLAALFTFRWTNTLKGQRCRDFHYRGISGSSAVNNACSKCKARSPDGISLDQKIQLMKLVFDCIPDNSAVIFIAVWFAVNKPSCQNFYGEK